MQLIRILMIILSVLLIPIFITLAIYYATTAEYITCGVNIFNTLAWCIIGYLWMFKIGDW